MWKWISVHCINNFVLRAYKHFPPIRVCSYSCINIGIQRQRPVSSYIIKFGVVLFKLNTVFKNFKCTRSMNYLFFQNPKFYSRKVKLVKQPYQTNQIEIYWWIKFSIFLITSYMAFWACSQRCFFILAKYPVLDMIHVYYCICIKLTMELFSFHPFYWIQQFILWNSNIYFVNNTDCMRMKEEDNYF